MIYPICVVIFCIFTATKIASGGERYRATLGTYAPLEFAFVVKDYLGDANFLADLQSIERGYDEAKRANSALDFNATQIKNVVLIIGESLQRGHMSLYGYGKDTTPLLNDLQRRGLLIKFSDTVSCYGATNPALMRILNFSDYESERERPWFESLSIIDMFALSGFRTMWISNQEAFGKFALSAKSAADRAEKKHLSFHKRSAR